MFIVFGVLELIDELVYWLMVLMGMYVVVMSLKVGVYGEFCGMMVIKVVYMVVGCSF